MPPFSTPEGCYRRAGLAVPWLAGAAALLAVLGGWIGWFVAPIDAQQGQGYRIIFVHVPAAQMSLLVYVAMAGAAAAALVWRLPLAGMAARALAPTGAWCTALALCTGALWGKPMWGTWWVWDARLTSELLLLFLYLGFLALHSSITDLHRADRAAAVLAVVGVINVPVIHFSVQWWNTLHQGASLSLRGSTVAPPVLAGMAVMALAFAAYVACVALLRMRCLLLERERNEPWVRDVVAQRC
ncbi:heme ABC transporter permease CcmC [Candidatus Symbiobacter mobilis]|nr:heme ABC transporter permease CcmC [Candidatus Symbiobacter mobilis]